MASYNKATLVGRLTRDPETTTTQGGSSVTKFGVAVGRSKKDANGQWANDPNPLFMDCEAWTSQDGKGVGKAATYLKKGSQVLVEGELRTQSWTDKTTGQQRSKIVLNVQKIEFLDSKADGQPRNGADDLGNQHDNAPQGESSIPF